ncbi:7592_t:CDS:2 [Dentiscutata erythropus]|uniref:7592_t:CDS:1 n=1 Tax=Dentiscutata erythropus TaxID=1348616 RepID=A0A9N9G8V2_9GLOM|nr:7592_t:CDS:2 [Dentiscutata erythropus]
MLNESTRNDILSSVFALKNTIEDNTLIKLKRPLKEQSETRKKKLNFTTIKKDDEELEVRKHSIRASKENID